jgi:hypothetical protein
LVQRASRHTADLGAADPAETVEALPPTPEEATASTQDDVQHIKERARR